MSIKQLEEFIQVNREFSTKDLNAALGIRNDYTSEVPFLQFPVPGPRGSAHAVALSFGEALDPASVTADSVMMVVRGEPTPVPADVRLVDERTILVQPDSPLRQGRLDDDLVHIIVTPNVSMADGRPFAGLLVVVSAG